MTPTTELAEKLERECAGYSNGRTSMDVELILQAADTLRKQAEELERCRTALSEPVTDAEWSTAYLDMVGMTMSEEDAVETRPNQRGAMVTQILMRRRLARSAYAAGEGLPRRLVRCGLVKR